MTTHEAALLALDAALDAAEASGEHVPCRVPEHAPAWLSDRHEDRAEAAQACEGCPALDACAEVGRHEPFGVWGGRDVTQRPGKARTPPKPRPPKPRPTLDPITCPGCSTPFVPSRPGHLYCRQACRTRLASAERRRRAKENA